MGTSAFSELSMFFIRSLGERSCPTSHERNKSDVYKGERFPFNENQSIFLEMVITLKNSRESIKNFQDKIGDLVLAIIKSNRPH